MKEVTTSKARILFVSVPEEAKAFHIGDFTGNLNYFRGLLIRPCSIELPDGQWQFLSLLKDATESQAQQITDNLESLHSLAKHLGCEGNQAILIEETI